MATTLATLIARMEGWGIPNVWATLNNNPGNLRNVGQTGAVGTNGGYAVFSSPEAGWTALEKQLQYNANRGDTVQTFITSYAPPSENDTGNYLNFLTSGLGVPASTPLSQVLGTDQVSESGTSGIVPAPSSYDVASMFPDLSGVSMWVWIAAAGGIGLLLFLKRD
jgi:hypothetical protein